MGQHRFEKQFKNTLGQREIKPADKSWDKLKLKLDKEEKSARPVFWWMGIAATLVAGILILGQIYRTNSIEETPSVVETPVELKMEDEKTGGEQKTQLAIEEIEKPVVEEEIQNKNLVRTPPVPQKKTITQITYEVETLTEENAVAEVTTEEPKELLPAGLEEAIAAVSSNLAENDDLTEAEVNTLLMMAAARISREKPVYTVGETVDADSLLWDVEMEMDQSFREKVFDIMKEGYLKARTAVANRNY